MILYLVMFLHLFESFTKELFLHFKIAVSVIFSIILAHFFRHKLEA